MQLDIKETVEVGPNEPCHWISERVVTSPELGIPIRVQSIVVRRGGDLVMRTEPMKGGVRLPPIEFNAGGAVSVDKAKAHMETVRHHEIQMPDPITVTIGGDSYIEADHPALESIPNASPNDRS